jgi:hypothetical protein
MAENESLDGRNAPGAGPARAATDLFELALRYWAAERVEDALRVARQVQALVRRGAGDPVQLADVARTIREIEGQMRAGLGEAACG